MSIGLKTSLEIKKFGILSHKKSFAVAFTFDREGSLQKMLDGLAMEEFYFGRNATGNHAEDYSEVLADYKALSEKLSNRYHGEVTLVPVSGTKFKFDAHNIPFSEMRRIVLTDFSEGMEDDLTIGVEK